MFRRVAIAVALGAVVYIIMLPVPADIERPHALKFTTLAIKVMNALSTYTPFSMEKWLFRKLRELGPDVPYKDTQFDGVEVRVYDDQPEGTNGEKLRPAIVYFHGGGWTMGNVDMHHSLTAEFARNLSALVVSVGYRLAPKAIFPAAIDDCTRATVSLLNHLEEFDVDPKRIAVMGDSAGGNLAAAVAQRLTFDPQYTDLPKIKIQVLIYPGLQPFDFRTPSYQQNGDYKTLILDTRAATFAWSSYMGKPVNERKKMAQNIHTSQAAKTSPLVKRCLSHDLIPAEFKLEGYEAPSNDFGDDELYDEIQDLLLNPDLAPLMREDLRGLPEAYILTAQYDILRDDGIMYATRLQEAGVKVTWKHYKKGFHGMFTSLDGPLTCPAKIEAIDDFYNYIKPSL